METTTSNQGNDQRPLSAHTKKQIRFAEILAKGIYSVAEAARQAGYKQSVADGRAYQWLGKTREASEYPVLWDYYEKLRRENLREFDITAESIARELALIGFSDLTRFIDLPRKEYENKSILAQETEVAVWSVETYRERLEAYEQAIEKQAQQKRGRKAKLTRPKPPTEKDHRLHTMYAELSEEERRELMVWKNYRAGSIRLKNREEIPEALLPALAEISETKDGIRIKLHDKISALDKLAKWRKMYAADNEEDGGAGRIVTEINLTVNGTRSTLLQEEAAA